MEVPQPTKSADDVYEISSAIITMLLPPLALFKAGADALLRKRLEHGQRILISEIRKSGLHELSDEKWDSYIPSAYTFFEQVRLGEYDHNLRLLARMIAGDLSAAEGSSDIGTIGRAAKKIEMLPRTHLVALSRCPRAFEIYANSDESDGYWICIDQAELRSSYIEVGLEITVMECEEYLHELACRGILTSGGRPSRIGGPYYYRNSVFNEIIVAAQELPNEE